MDGIPPPSVIQVGDHETRFEEEFQTVQKKIKPQRLWLPLPYLQYLTEGSRPGRGWGGDRGWGMGT